MGGAVSRGRDNDELVDNLIESRYIRTKSVEHVFRAVDRADYVLSSHRESAYKDSAWKHGNIHLSAPCVYSEVMEGLSLEPGMSFLNLGSGTGYLSTMAGLILGQSGINHGIELHEDCVKYAYDRLEEFKQKSLALDEFDFCEPSFIQGNCLSLMPGRRYDRVYCGAACPEEYEVFIKQFVSIGGILVMPSKDHLQRMQRVGETLWKQRTMLPVSFATLVAPTTTEQNLLHLPECDPVSLQELCRSRIRRRLREKVWFEHKELEIEKPILQERPKFSSPQRTLGRFVIPIFEESDETLSSGDEEYSGRAGFIIHNHPGEPITTTLQLVRAVIQPNQREGRQNTQESRPVDSDDNQSNSNELTDNQVNSTELCDNQLNHNELFDLELKCKKKLGSLNKNSHTYGYHSEVGSDSTCERSENPIEESRDTSVDRERCVDKDYTIISESESETELEAPIQRAKMAKREKMDSGIEDSNVTNDDNRSSSNQLSSDSESGDGDAMDVDLSDIIPTRAFENSHSNDSTEEKAAVAHYIDSNALHSYMIEKIHQLPLPHSLKLYINYDRKL